jgi:hypothetical protein
MTRPPSASRNPSSPDHVTSSFVTIVLRFKDLTYFLSNIRYITIKASLKLALKISKKH